MSGSQGDGLVGPETYHKAQGCLGCGAKIERSAVVGGQSQTATTKAGDFAVCNVCGMVMRWSSRMRLRALRPEEQSVADRHPGIQALSRACRTRAQAT
jgi:hypothetical protein